VSPVSAPADRRFRRAHVKPGRRRRDWRRLAGPLTRGVLAGAAVLYGGYRAAAAASHGDLLQIERIVVRGTDHLSRGEVLALVGGLRGQNLMWADLDGWRTKLLGSPWVRDAELRRVLPSTVEVIVSERQPIAIGRIGGDLYLVDEQGTVLDQYGPQDAGFDLPIVDGLTDGQPGRGIDPARADLAARVISAVRARPEIAHRISQIDVRNLRDATVILDDDPAIIHLGDRGFVSRLESYLDVASALRERVGEIDYVDLRFDGRVYVGPASSDGARRRGRQDDRSAPPRQGSGGNEVRNRTGGRH
jgi:cell division protein FtsQ